LPAWSIDGAAARELMTTFWRELILCDDPATALRRAKLARLEANRAAHAQALPGTWAGFWLCGHAGR
jgi:CHAT domain-containing protein